MSGPHRLHAAHFYRPHRGIFLKKPIVYYSALAILLGRHAPGKMLKMSATFWVGGCYTFRTRKNL